MGDEIIASEIFHNDSQSDRPRSAGFKRLCIMYNELDPVQFTSETLKELAQNCRYSWMQYFLAIDDRDPEEREKPEVRKMLDLAPNPSYWVDKFSVALAELPPAMRAVLPIGPIDAPGACGLPSSYVGIKRKNRDSFENDEEFELRRSKRLKAMCVHRRL